MKIQTKYKLVSILTPLLWVLFQSYHRIPLLAIAVDVLASYIYIVLCGHELYVIILIHKFRQ
jgi:hypothetical protein